MVAVSLCVYAASRPTKLKRLRSCDLLRGRTKQPAIAYDVPYQCFLQEDGEPRARDAGCGIPSRDGSRRHQVLRISPSPSNNRLNGLSAKPNAKSIHECAVIGGYSEQFGRSTRA